MPGKITFLAFFAVMVLCAAPAGAHELDTSYTTITIMPGGLETAFVFDAAELARSFAVPADGGRSALRERLTAHMPVVYDYLEKHTAVSVDSAPLRLQRRAIEFREDETGILLVKLVFRNPLKKSPEEISLDAGFFGKFGKSHKNLVQVVSGGQTHQTVLTGENPRQSFPVSEQPALLAQIGKFVMLGIEHIFLGYDHIAFLLALIVIGSRFMALVKIVTAFTAAHSITLMLAALQVVAVPPRLIESGIAVSIAYVAGENFVIKKVDHRWVLAFFFGLVHGFGFANALRETGLPAKGLIPSLFAFNAGVEIGQICIVGMLFPLTVLIAKQKFRRVIVFAVSAVILALGLLWFAERAFGLGFMPF